MTGGEAAAAVSAAKAAAAAGKAALGEEAPTKAQLAELAKDSPQMKRAASDWASRVAVKQAILLKLYQPLARVLGISKEYFDNDFGTDLAEKTAGIPDEDLVSPKPSIALPAMMGLAFSLDESELKEMYLSLLATASDGRRPTGAHPSFAEIIKQLDSAEVKSLSAVLGEGREWPIVELRRNLGPSEGFNSIQRHVLPTGVPALREVPAHYVDNWQRLGLVEVDYMSYLTDEGPYDFADALVEELRERISLSEGQTFGFQKGLLRVTAFGQAFASAVGVLNG